MATKDYQAIKRRKNNKKNKKFSFILKPKILALLCLIFLFLVFFPLAKNYGQKRIVDQEIAEIKREIAEFEAKNRELKEMFSYLESDSGYQEIARLNLGLKSPGEEVIVIEDLLIETNQAEVKLEIRPNWQKWLDYFFY